MNLEKYLFIKLKHLVNCSVYTFIQSIKLKINEANLGKEIKNDMYYI